MSKEETQPRAWFTIDELNAWADKKLKENPQWAEQPAQYSGIVSDGGMDPRNKFDAIEAAHGIKE